MPRWKLTTEQSLFLGHPVMKATAEHEGDQIEAWFTPDIPISGGPEGYGGLPGMILTLTVNDGERSYTATAVTLGEPPVEIKAPTDGKEVTREEFDKIVADKMAEMEKTRGGRRGGDAVMIIKQDG
jgi:GLPGLI family protein